MSTTAVPDRFTALPDEHALQATVTALEEYPAGSTSSSSASRSATERPS